MGCTLNPGDCNSITSTSADEIDTVQFLSTFATYAQARRPALLANIGPYEHVILLTTRDFAGAVLELAFQQVTCSTSNSASVAQVRSTDTPFNTGFLFAHALGHSMGMQHDSSGTFIMSPSGMGGTTYSAASKLALTNQITAGNTTCLDNGARSAWNETRCGDGRVDTTEACDPGGHPLDVCCTSTCQIAPTCSCSNNDLCCASGAVKSSGTVCRPATGGCDVADLCDGVNANCANDHVVGSGTTCGDAGVCFRGECSPSRSELCVSLFGSAVTGVCTANQTNCANNGLFCQLPGGSCAFATRPVPDGLSCGAMSQCLSGSCTASSVLKDSAWRIGSWSACTGSGTTRTRTVRCEDELGGLVADALCALPMPSATGTCP